jgi:VIT1/CCC1 family predicted Fe2+/Mn2+ transporter
MNKHGNRKAIAESMREIVFGVEDGLVSTLGAVTGIAAGSQSTKVVILSGVVLLVVEALSMGAGSYLSSKNAMTAIRSVGERSHEHPIRGGFIMGAFYIVGGAVPLAPYFFLDIERSYFPSIFFTALLLFGIGAWAAWFSRRSAWRGGVEMTVVSLSAAGLGFLIGRLVGAAFGVHVL